MFYLDERHANSLVPGKRPRTTLTPSLALRDGQPWLAFGTPGGDQQDQWSLQFLLNVVDFGMDLQEALDAPSVQSTHFPGSFYPHAAEPGGVRVESRIPESVRDELERARPQGAASTVRGATARSPPSPAKPTACSAGPPHRAAASPT